MSAKSPELSINFRLKPPPIPEPPKPEPNTVRREIDRLARQTEGITKALKRLKEAV